MFLSRILTGLLCGLTLVSCAAVPLREQPKDNQAMRLIATDLVGILKQVPTLSVDDTTLTLSPAEFIQDDFGKALQAELEEVGYAIRTVDSNPGDQPVSYNIDPVADSQSNDSLVSTFVINMGSVSVRRQYADFDSAQVHPVSTLQIKGADAIDLQIDDTLFKRADLERPQQEPELASARSVTIGEPPSERANVGEQDVSLAGNDDSLSTMSDAAAVAQPVVDEEQAPPATGSPMEPALAMASMSQSLTDRLSELQMRPRVNFRDIRRSNFADFFDSLTLVREAVIPFDNDAVQINPIAEEEIARFIHFFDADSDVFSVIGCSNGRTDSPDGPRGLALSRAAAVSMQLQRFDVPAQSILEEGCWSGEHFDEMMPRRGVVLTLRRLPSSD